MIDPKKLIDEKDYCEKVFNFFLKKGIIKIDKFFSFKKHLDKSINNLMFANFILSEHNSSIREKLPSRTFYDWCINIYYYSLYHSALALISKSGFESKNHLATITALTLFYYHKKSILKKEDIKLLIDSVSIEKEEIKLLLDTKELRERASYGVELFEKKQAENLRGQVAEFINKAREILELG